MRARGMQVLTDQIKAKRPGATIYGIGDEDHQEHTSGHNPDDTPGVSAEDQDADTVAEHRAIDVMVMGPFSQADGDRLVQDLVTDPANQARMIYVNWGNQQWHRKNGWQPRDNSDDPHSHVHVSGEADQDENVTPWNLSDWNGQGNDMDFNQSQQLYAVFNLVETIKLDTDATPDGAGALKDFPVPITKRVKGLETQVAAILAKVSAPIPVTLNEAQLAELSARVAAAVTEKVLRPMADAAQAEAESLDAAVGD